MRIAHDTLDGVRYAAIIDGKNLHMVYARPDDNRPWAGDILSAKVTRYASAQRAYFLDINGDEGFLPHKDASLFAAGDTIVVKIERPATPTKKIRCSIAIDQVETQGDDILAQAQRDFPDITDITQGLQDFDRALIALRDETIVVQQGLEIVIEETAAFVAIDINNADPSLKPFEANRLAMIEILRQMRLRNLSGQVIVDFLRLHNPEQRKKMYDFLQEEIKRDPFEIALYGFTKLGLFEMTRAKNGLPLASIIV